MTNEMKVFKNELFEVAVKETAIGIEFDVDKIARGLGFTKTEVKNGKTYVTVRWNTVNEHLEKYFDKYLSKGDFIAEPYVYKLAMKASNETAEKFQDWLAFDVIPSIRKNKVYIDPTATDAEIDNAVRFATPQKRRLALIDATIDGKDSIFNVYESIKEYIKNWCADDKITAYKHIERVLEDKKDAYGKDIALVHKVEELNVIVAKDLDKVKSWKNGAAKRELNKECKLLEQQLNELKSPAIDEYHMIPIHGFSHNKQYEITSNGKWGKTKEYKAFCDYFPYFMMPTLEELNVDFNKPMKIYLAFDHKPSYDTQNLVKSAIDLIVGYYGQNDNNIREHDIKANTFVDNIKDGKIYFILKNI